MHPFLLFYKKVLVLKHKYPSIDLAIYSDKNLEILWGYVEFLDQRKRYYSPGDAAMLHLGAAARQKPAEERTLAQVQAMLDAVAIKQHFDVFQRAKTELSKKILPALKATIMVSKDIKNEDKALQHISDIEAQWNKQKKYARYSACELDEIMLRVCHLMTYRGIIQKDIANKSPLLSSIREELQELDSELNDLLQEARKELIDPMLGRLVLVPSSHRYVIAHPPSAEENRIQKDQIYDENVLAVTLTALTEVGLDSGYVEAFKKQTAAHSTLSPVIERFETVCQSIWGSEAKKVCKRFVFDARLASNRICNVSACG